MIHPHTELKFISKEIGHGVVATKLIPKGTITWVLDDFDQIFTPEYVKKLGPIHKNIVDTYCYRNSRGNYVLCWDIARFVNHSFNANCLTTAYGFEIAIRDIHPGEQLTDDYGYLNIEEPFECLPEENTERRVVMPDDPIRMHKEWDAKLEMAFSFINAVDQPLFPVVKEHTQKKIDLIVAGKKKMDSILNCYIEEAQKKKKVVN